MIPSTRILMRDRAGEPMEIIRDNGCLGCHALGEDNANATAPPLDPKQLVPRLTSRLSSSEYEADLRTVDDLSREPFTSYREARAQILQLEGIDRVRLWLENRLREPRFDDPGARMPKPNLTTDEILILTDFFMTTEETNQSDPGPVDDRKYRLRIGCGALLPEPMGIRHLASFLIAGAVIGWLSLELSSLRGDSILRRDQSNGNRANSENS